MHRGSKARSARGTASSLITCKQSQLEARSQRKARPRNACCARSTQQSSNTTKSSPRRTKRLFAPSGARKSWVTSWREREERKEWQTVTVEEGTHVSPSRMFAIQDGTETDMAATNTLEKCMRMGHPWMWWDPMGERLLFLAMERKYKPRTVGRSSSPKVLQTPRPPRWNRDTVAPRELASSAPDEERGSGKQSSVPSSTAAAPERRRQTPTSSTPVKRTAKPSAPSAEKKRKTDHRSLASKHVWVLNAATQVRNAIETTAEWSWTNTKQFFEKAGCKAARRRASPRRLLSGLPHAEPRRDQREVRRRGGCSDRQIREGVRANH